ncbi:hypothetical protein [Pedobacter sp. Leaf250]|uniref:hypothetical protein n=1 Tax=Pedobacter sp. Leaf250 TaxID=2876559 RepID=UPI001E58B95D|nr:hypothetical protein [Pedobacter sp. Leaf250]
MKNLILFFSLLIFTNLCYSQGREPAGHSGRTPAGGSSSERNNSGPNGSGGNPSTRAGKNSVSPEAVKTSNEINSVNSPFGNGKNQNSGQRAEAINQMERERTKAAAEGRRADAGHFQKEIERLKEIDKPVTLRKPVNMSKVPLDFSKIPKRPVPYGLF